MSDKLINVIDAINAVNAVILMTVNSMQTIQKMNAVIASAQLEGRAISKEEWDSVISDADSADARLAMAIESASEP